jgi:hypothetical protein
MVIHSAIDNLSRDWGKYVLAAATCLYGIVALLNPVSLSRLFKLMNRNSPGELMAYANPTAVAESRILRLRFRFSGAILLAFGLTLIQVIRDGIDAFCLCLIGLGVGLVWKPISVLVVFGGAIEGGELAAARHIWGLRVVGFVSTVVGGWLLFAHR